MYMFTRCRWETKCTVDVVRQTGNSLRMYWVGEVDKVLKEKEIPFEISLLILHYTIAPLNVNFFYEHPRMYGCEGVLDKRIRKNKERKKEMRHMKARRKALLRKENYEAYIDVMWENINAQCLEID